MAKDLWMNDPILFLMKSVGVDFSVSRKDWMQICRLLLTNFTVS
jgi:hypothetical protein